MTDGPKRYSSQELTAVIPRENLPPPSSKLLATLDLDPEHPETVDLARRALDDDEEDCADWRSVPTLVPCPAGCRTCGACHGMGMISSDEAAAWRIAQADAKNELPDDAA